ncbi:MAG: hypothetical protein QOH57_2198 [Mycobacterium sp.]|nr:hypothetical protein [Mycobacterium sp.]
MTLRVRREPAALVRGVAVALLTATLSAAAHAAAGGLPSGGGIALLVLLAGTLGVITVIDDRSGDAITLVVVLACGQALGHVVLGCGGHGHAEGAVPSPAMVGAHLAALGLGALLISAGGRFCRLLSTAIRALLAPTLRPVPWVGAVTTTSDQPLLSLLLATSSLSYRGPPAGLPR